MFARPQQKSDPTDVDEAGGVDPCHHGVCNERLWEKGNSKGEKCDGKNSKVQSDLGGEQAGSA